MKFADYTDWVNFVQKGQVSPIRPGIMDSWKRSRDFGLSPYAFPLKFENPETRPLDKNFFNQVKNYLNGLFKSFAESKVAWVLCDEACCVREVFSRNPVLEEHLGNLNLKPGAFLSEASAGTNAVGLAAFLKNTVICSGPEHYLEKFHSLASTAAPLYDSNGELKGYVALIGIVPETDVRILRGTILMLIQLFDRDIRLLRSKEMHDELKKLIGRIYKEDLNPIFLVTRTGYLRLFNPAASKLLELDKKFIEEKNMDKLASFNPQMREVVRCAMPCKDEKMEIRLENRRLQVRYERIPLFSERDEFVGSIIIFSGQTERRSAASVSEARYYFEDIIGSSPALLRAKELARRAADTSVSVFLHGPSGTGKEIFAHSIHNASERQEYPFVAINCAAIPKEIAESELFGYTAGAFTGAKKGGNIGKLEAADQGTVFLDEIGDMPFELQSKLLRLLEQRTISRIGGRREIPVNIRVIAASNRDIPELIEKGEFREDLYYRLNVTSIELPTLAESREDIPELVAHFIAYFNELMGKKVTGIRPDIMESFKNYSWPGNIRELKNAIEFGIMLNSGEDVIGWKHLPGQLRAPLLYQEPQGAAGADDPLNRERQGIENSERALYEKAIRMAHGNVSEAARILNIGRSTIYRKIRKFGIKVN